MEEVTLPELPDPSLWVLPGDDGGRASGFVDAMAWEEGEFTKPMFTAVQMREFARAAVLMERDRCAKVCEQLAENGPGNWKHGTPGDCAAAIRKGE